MRDISLEILDLLDKYGSNRKQALQEHSKLEYLYALSDLRENLLEWYPFNAEASLLQVGADFGALTGLFARRVKEVTVLDSLESQLQVCQQRYSQMQNVHYLLGDLLDMSWEKLPRQQFDYITLIGSLGDSAQQELDLAKQLLTPEGLLILAIDNPFGVKYLAGAVKDKVSFTKKRLLDLLERNDSGRTEWFYPIPDYRIATTIYSQTYLPKKGDLTKQLTVYDYPKYLQLDMGEMFDAVCEDDQFDQFANSFLVIWRNNGAN